MISIFPLWTFHLYVATIQQHLHMENISLIWYDNPELAVPIRISVIVRCCLQGSYWTKGFHWLTWSHFFESFTVATMTGLTAMDYLCHKCPRICSTCRKHFPVISSFFTRHPIGSGVMHVSAKDMVIYGYRCEIEVITFIINLGTTSMSRYTNAWLYMRRLYQYKDSCYLAHRTSKQRHAVLIIIILYNYGTSLSAKWCVM